ncbi:hypothetical protein [Pseudomonas sp. SDO52101_S400]
MPVYRKLTPLKIYYSDSSILAEQEIGSDPLDQNNPTYAKYGKSYATFKNLGGLNLKLSQGLIPVPIPVGAKLDFFGDNISNPPVSSVGFQFSFTFQNYGAGVQQDAMVVVGIPALKALGKGLIDFYGSVTIGNTIYLLPSSFITVI